MTIFAKLKKIYKRPRNWFFTLLALPVACIAYFFVMIGFAIALWISAPVLDHFFPSKDIVRYLAEQEYELLEFKVSRYFSSGTYYFHLKFPENVNPIPLNVVSYDYSLVSDDCSPDEKAEVEWISFPSDKFPDSSGVPKQGKGFKYRRDVGSFFYIHNYVPGKEPGEFYIKMEFP